jgi:glycosyltransferase involved in cell wall biosynthesis
MLRLARSLDQSGHEVSLFSFVPNPSAESLMATICPGIKHTVPDIKLRRIWQKIDSVLYFLKIDFSILRTLYFRNLRAYVKTEMIDIIHTHLFTADFIGARVKEHTGVPAICTVHGDYIRQLQQTSDHIPAKIRHFRCKMLHTLESYSAIVAITTDQIRFLGSRLRKEHSPAMVKIYNGFSEPLTHVDVRRDTLGIPGSAFVVGMVGRGIREKGWKDLIDGFRRADLPNSLLMLVGEGTYLDTLCSATNDPRIINVGQTDHPMDYIKLMDIACLMSKSENLPNVITEYLFSDKPIVAIATGEIPVMVGAGTRHECGFTIELDQRTDVAAELAIYLRRLHSNPELRERLALNTAAARGAFKMEVCLAAYESLYRRVAQQSGRQHNSVCLSS